MKKDFDYMQMLKGELYLAKDMAPEHRSIHGKKLAQAINNLPIENREEIVRLEKQLFGTTGEHIYVNPPLHVDYGRHVHLGENFYANMDCIFLDVNEIKIGNHVMLGPRVSLYTAGHPLDATIRNEQLEFGHPITIGDNVWLGGNVVVLPGVTIGNNVVVAAGAVVTKDIPENSLVGGNPAKLIRLLTEEDTAIWKQMKDDYYEAKAKFKTIMSQEG